MYQMETTQLSPKQSGTTTLKTQIAKCVAIIHLKLKLY